jgi:alpha-beta hydrolase superfamily lysophospholipase
MPFFDGVSGRVYYRHWAAASPAAALVFLHGFGEHTGLYHRYAAELGVHGVELWALDEIGHGLSDGERGHIGSVDDLADNADRLVDVVRKHRPGLPVVVSGHSLGSVAALYVALRRPDAFAGVVVSGAPLSRLDWVLAAAEPDAEPLDLDPAALSADPFYLDSLENDPLAFTGADVGPILAAAFRPAWDRLDADLPGLDLPVLAVHGAQDEVAPVDGVRPWVGVVPGLRLEVLQDAGHDVLNEVQHRQVASIVARFVTAHVADRTGPLRCADRPSGSDLGEDALT